MKNSIHKNQLMFYSDIMSKAPAVEVEASIFQDTDPSFQPAADRPLGVVAATQ